MHIENLYKAREILQFKECYALEKIHGTSAHVSWGDGIVHFFSGGVSHENFVKLFDLQKLEEGFRQLGHDKITIFGEAYGGKCQGMRETYGPDLRFVAFEVRIGDCWLDVQNAEQVANSLGLEFVYYAFIPTNPEDLDRERDRESLQAIRNGMESGLKREGIVLRPPFECTLNNGSRVIAKYKREDFQETKTPRPLDQDKLAVLQGAEQIAEEWVTEMRLTHVLDAFPKPWDITQTGAVIKAMTEDVAREAEGEMLDSKEARSAIGKKTAKMFKGRLGI